MSGVLLGNFEGDRRRCEALDHCNNRAWSLMMLKLFGRSSLHKKAPYIARRPFYRHYAYRGEVKLRSLDLRGAIDFDMGIFYNRIPKAANSFIISRLYALKSSEIVRRRTQKRSFMKPSELDNDGLLRFDKLFKFTFVRDPYSRTLSAYLDKILKKNRRIAAISSSRIPTFPEFCEYLEAEGLYVNPHWAPQTSLMVLPLDKFDFIGRIENLDSDLPRVMDAIGSRYRDAGEKEPLFRAPKADQQKHAHYDDRSYDIVDRLFAADFRLLGYRGR